VVARRLKITAVDNTFFKKSLFDFLFLWKSKQEKSVLILQVIRAFTFCSSILLPLSGQGHYEGKRGAQCLGCRIAMGAWNHCGLRRKVPTMSQVLLSI